MYEPSMYSNLVDRIIHMLRKEGAMRTEQILKVIDKDPALIRYVLGFMLKFSLVEYQPRKDVVKLSEPLRLSMERKGKAT
ncbi:MAG: hypothetical protein QXU32_09420 [Nitrososphaerales archaeon]